MALEVCVKAAVGAPDVLGDCNFFSLSVLDFSSDFARSEFWIFECRFRPVQPKGSSHPRGEESALQNASDQPLRQT